MKRLLTALAVAASLASGAAMADPTNLVNNGDFSSTTYSSNNEFGTGFGGQGVNGWSGNDGYNILFLNGTSTNTSANTTYGNTGEEMLWGTGVTNNNGVRAAAGSADPNSIGMNFVALDGNIGGSNPNGGISQLISGLYVGGVYTVTFDWGAGQLQSRTGATTTQLQVSLGNETQSTVVKNNASNNFSGWMVQAFTFTATAVQETLSFLSIGTPDTGPPIATLANVSMVNVPEPMSLSLFGAGLAGLAIARRRKR